MVNDLRQTLRVLRRAPWYSATIVGVIALGMALATTVFAVVDGVLFKPIALPDADRLFTVRPGFKGLAPRADYDLVAVSRKDIDDWSAVAADAAFTGFSAQPFVGYGAGVNDDTAGVVRVQPNVFDVLGTRPLMGGFDATDFDRDVRVRSVIVTYDVWQGRFHGDPDILGRTVENDPVGHFGYRIVGVMPRGFVFPSESTDVKFIMPFVVAAEAATDPRRRGFGEVIVRAPAALGAEALRGRIETGMRATAAAFPALGPKPEGWSDNGWRRQGPFDRAEVSPLAVTLGSRSRPLFSAVFLAVVVLIAIGALNVSGLMAARTLDRARELGVRRALGASNVSVARLIFVECLTLIGAGSVVGLAIAWPLLRLTLSLLPEEIVLLKSAVIDWRVSAFVAAGSVLLAIPTALWPIRRAIGLRVATDGHASAGRASERTRSVGRFLVVASQVAGGFVLTLGGALLVGSLLAVYANDMPIRTDDVILVEVQMQGPSGGGMARSPERNARINPLLDRVRQVPGVGAVAITSAQILKGGSWNSLFTPPEGARKVPGSDIDVQGVTSDYYRVVQPQLVAGRFPTDDELERDAPVLVVSQSLAHAYWPTGPAVGRPLLEERNPVPYTVVGVVKDVRWYSWDIETASIYGPFALLARAPTLTYLIRPQGEAGPAMTETLRALQEPNLLVRARRATMLDDLFVESVRPRRFQAWLFGSFAAAGLGIVAVGILGLLAMATARRVKEVGIRYALGATPIGIVRMLLREQLTPVLAGLIAGGVIAGWAVTLVEKYLYKVTTDDPRIWATAAALILAAAAIGALVPAVRASRTDPVQALRLE
jgi:putative ABC transport system permease protein